MVSPIGGPSGPLPSNPPIITINVPSPTAFGIMRELVRVIHAAHAQQNMHYQQARPMEHRHYHQMHSPLLNPRRTEPEVEEIEVGMPPFKPSGRPPEGGGRPQGEQEPSLREASAPDKPRQELPSDFKVPDFTNHASRRDDKAGQDRMVAEMLDKLAKLVKLMHIAKEAAKPEVKRADAVEVAARQAGEGKKIEGQQADKLSLSEEESHQIDLILENIGENGLVERVSVERGEIAALLKNLEGILGEEEVFTPQAEDRTGPEEKISQKRDNSFKEGNSSEQDVAQKGAVKKNAMPKVGGQPIKGAVPGIVQGQHPGAGLAGPQPPAMAAAAMASFMPYTGQQKAGAGKAPEEDPYRIEQVEKGTPPKPLGEDSREAKESDKAAIEGVIAKETVKKSAREKDVQAIADTAKDQRVKKTPTQRLEDEKIIPVHGKFSVDQLKSVRRRRGKGKEGGGSGKGEETYRLIDVLYMILCAAVCGAQTVFDITAFIESREKWLTTVLGLRSGLPSAQLITRLIASFNPAQIPDMLNVWVREAQGAPSRSGLASITIIETFEGLIFAQEKSGGSSTAALCMPKIFQFIELRGIVAFLSNGKESKQMMDKIIGCGGHYVYDCGEEPLPLEEEVLPLFEQAYENPKETPQVHIAESYIEGQEHLQLFEMEVEGLPHHVRSAVQLLAEVRTEEGREETVQYFTSSLSRPSVWLFELLRSQRSVEGNANWMINMSMRGKQGEEASFAAREFLALIRRYAVGLLLRDQSFKAPLYAKQQRAAKENDYLMKLLKL